MKYILVLTMLYLLPCTSGAQSLLSNGEFDSGVSNWFAFSTISWVDDDGAAISGIGSMMNSGVSNNNSSFPAISDKFTVIPGYWYLLGSSYKVPSASPVPRAHMVMFWYDDMDAEITNDDAGDSGFGVTNDVWGDLTGMVQAPSAAVSGELRLYFQTAEPENLDTPFGLWDDVYVFEETIFFSGFN